MEVGGQRRIAFTEAAMREVHRLSGGVPRLINAICDRALLGAYAHDLTRIEPRTLRAAASEVLGRTVRPRYVMPAVWGAAALGRRGARRRRLGHVERARRHPSSPRAPPAHRLRAGRRVRR